MSNRKGMYDLPPKRQESDLDEDVLGLEANVSLTSLAFYSLCDVSET